MQNVRMYQIKKFKAWIVVEARHFWISLAHQGSNAEMMD